MSASDPERTCPEPNCEVLVFFGARARWARSLSPTEARPEKKAADDGSDDKTAESDAQARSCYSLCSLTLGVAPAAWRQVAGAGLVDNHGDQALAPNGGSGSRYGDRDTPEEDAGEAQIGGAMATTSALSR